MAPTDEPRVADVRRRRRTFREALARRRIDVAVITAEPNFTYLSGYVTPSWTNRSRPMALLVRADDDAATAIVSAAEADRIAELAVDVEPAPYLDPEQHVAHGTALLDFGRALVTTTVNVLRGRRTERIATELGAPAPSGLPAFTLLSVGDQADWELVDVAPLLWPLRQRKSEYEIGCVRRAAAALERTFERFAAAARPTMTERELLRELTAAAARSGADRLGYSVVVAGATRPLLGPPGDRVWSPGELLMVDVGLLVDGYWADFCRHFAAEDISLAQGAAYARLVAAGAAGREAVRETVTAGAVAAAIADVLPDGNRAFGRLGHGVGLEIAEPPSVHRDDPTALEPGMLLCIEPSAWFDGVGHLVGEEMVAVGADGGELLSPAFPSRLEVLAR